MLLYFIIRKIRGILLQKIHFLIMIQVVENNTLALGLVSTLTKQNKKKFKKLIRLKTLKLSLFIMILSHE
jgi:hypothetical protein